MFNGLSVAPGDDMGSCEEGVDDEDGLLRTLAALGTITSSTKVKARSNCWCVSLCKDLPCKSVSLMVVHPLDRTEWPGLNHDLRL